MGIRIWRDRAEQVQQTLSAFAPERLDQAIQKVYWADKALREELRAHVGKEIGPVAKPDDIRFAEALPKTRSGKIMRRLLKQVASGVEIKGDTTTLEDFSVLAKLGSAEE